MTTIAGFSIEHHDFGVLARNASACTIVCTYPIEDGTRVMNFVEPSGDELTTIGIELHRFLVNKGVSLKEEELLTRL